jgi:hypothetical protein
MPTLAPQQQAVARLAKLLRSPQHRPPPSNFNAPALPLLPWTILRRSMLDPKTPFSLRDHHDLIDIYSLVAREIIVKKAAQRGLSEWLVSYALHACDERGMDVIYTMPTDADVSDFSQSRFGPALEASPYLASIVIGGPAATSKGKQRGADKVTLKRVGNSFLYFRGGRIGADGRARQLKSVPADAIILDELDEMDPRAPEIARKRLGHSAIAEVRAISTPTLPNVGIDAMWQQSDQREWHIRCVACNHWQKLTIHHIVTGWDELERPTAWHGGPDDAWPACEKCARPLNRLAPGQWVARHPGREVVGFHPTKLTAPVASLLTIIKGLQTTDETRRREAFNQDLGETYTPRGGQLTDEVLDACRRDYGHGPLAVTGDVFMGVDVGKVLHGVIRGPLHLASGETPQLWAGEIDTWDELGRTMRRFNVRTLVIDALPETTKAREFQAQFAPGVVWLAYYSSSDSKRAEAAAWDEANGVVNLDRTRSLDATFSRFYEGLNTLPAHARAIKDFYAHLKAPVRTLETRRNGITVAIYVEASADHLAHAENYCLVARSAPRPAAPVVRSRVVKE